MKKIIKWLLVLAMAVGCAMAVPVVSNAATEGKYTYTVSKGEAKITDFDESERGKVVIPSRLGRYPVTSIGNGAFANCSGLTSVTIPDSVTSIEGSAFCGCYRLTSITIPNSVTDIEGSAFYACSSLTSITIPDSVTSIGDYVFYECGRLKSINVSENNAYYSSIDGNLYNKDATQLIQYARGKAQKRFAIPDSVTRIGNYAFAECSSLTSITIPDSVTSIWDGAFRGCAGLVSIAIPDGVTSIDNYTFSECSSLTSITIPDSVTSICHGAFYGCTAIETVNYDGTEDEWNAITVESNNECLTNAKINMVRRYTYTFKNGDGSVIDSGTILYGEAIPKTDKIPEKEGTAEFSYTFTGWEGYSDGMTITEDITFEPIFEATTNQYTYKFISGDEVITEVTADYGSVITVPEVVPEGEFPLVFSEWEGYSDGMTLTGDCEFYAAFKNRSFTVTPDSGEAVEVIYGDDYVLGFSEKPG